MTSLIAHRKLKIYSWKKQQQHSNCNFQPHSTERILLVEILPGMHISSHYRLEVLFKGTPYLDTFRYIQKFKPKQVHFQNIFYNLDHILYSHTCSEWVFYIRDFNNEPIALFCLPIFPPQATPKLSEILYTDIVYTVNLDAIPASYDIKYIKELLSLYEQCQQIVKQQQHNK